MANHLRKKPLSKERQQELRECQAQLRRTDALIEGILTNTCTQSYVASTLGLRPQGFVHDITDRFRRRCEQLAPITKDEMVGYFQNIETGHARLLKRILDIKEHDRYLTLDPNSEAELDRLLDTVISVRDAAMVRMICGFDGEERSLQSVANTYGITHSRVQQILNRTLMTLRQANHLRVLLPNYVEYMHVHTELVQLNELIRESQMMIDQMRGEYDHTMAMLYVETPNEVQRTTTTLTTPLSLLVGHAEGMLSVRAYNALSRGGYGSLGDVVDAAYEDLLTIRNLGVATAREIVAFVHAYGFTMRGACPHKLRP